MLNIPSLKDSVSPEEWQIRCDLAACYRLVAAYGWSDLIFMCGNIPVRRSQQPFSGKPP